MSVVIISGARTPMGNLNGSLSQVSATELGAIAIKSCVEKSTISVNAIDEVVMGNVLSAGLGQGPARQASLKAGLNKSTGCVTINKLCGSGMQATIYAHDMIAAGTASAVIAGGMENMSQAPHIIHNARQGLGTGHKQVSDHMFSDGLEDAETGRLMGSFAQETADSYKITREQMDDFSIQSLTRAKHAMEKGLLENEICPVTFSTRKGDVTITEDEQPLKANLDKIPTLRPAFKKEGTITAANASSISDGASALLLMSETEANAQNIKPLAKIIGHSRFSRDPSEFTLAPIGAIEKLLAKINWTIEDVDLWEINEAFAMVTMLPIKELKLDPEKVNIYGGACAQGHPVGSTGSRIILTLINALKNTNKKRGVAALCIGGGEATAVAIEIYS